MIRKPYVLYVLILVCALTGALYALTTDHSTLLLHNPITTVQSLSEILAGWWFGVSFLLMGLLEICLRLDRRAA